MFTEAINVTKIGERDLAISLRMKLSCLIQDGDWDP